MEVWGLTDIGNVREQNQDYYLTLPLENAMAAVLCDGMGGAKAGNIASKLAAEVFLEEIRRAYREHMEPDMVMFMLDTAVGLANTAVYENSLLSEEMYGMGTTLVGVLLYDRTLYTVNVGDSRAYLLNRREVRQITIDHSLVELMVRRGELTREEAKTFPGKNVITRAVGTERSVRADIFKQPLYTGDNILLCSDGLSNLLADQELLFEVVHGARKRDCCRRLVEIAKSRGAPDNVTVLLISL